MLPASRTQIAHIRKDSHTCTICRMHFITKSSSCSRRFCIACFLSPVCSCLPREKVQSGGAALPRGPSITGLAYGSGVMVAVGQKLDMSLQACWHADCRQSCRHEHAHMGGTTSTGLLLSHDGRKPTRKPVTEPVSVKISLKPV